MNTKDKKAVLETVLDASTPLKEVTMAPRNIFEKIKLYFKPAAAKREMLFLSALTLRTNYKITYLIADILTGSNQIGQMERLIESVNLNTFQMARIIATAIHNQNSKTPEHLVETILDNFSNTELYTTTREVYRRLDVQSFFDSMALLRTLSLIETTPDQDHLGPSSEE